MTLLQWIVAAVTSIFVAAVAFLQWRTAQEKAVLDLFDRRFKIYETVKNCVDHMKGNPQDFGGWQEKEFLKAVNEAHFFFDDDLDDYLETLRKAILTVRDTTKLQATTADRDQAISRIDKFYEEGRPKFAKYMRFTQTVPSTFGSWLRGLLGHR